MGLGRSRRGLTDAQSSTDEIGQIRQTNGRITERVGGKYWAKQWQISLLAC